jgi:transposase
LYYIGTQYHQAWANDMARLLDIEAAVDATRPHASCLSSQRLAAFARRYDAVVQAGWDANSSQPPPVTEGQARKRGRPKQPPPVNLLLRLRDFKGQVLAFMYDLHVPFDNNQGEHDVRMVKVK